MTENKNLINAIIKALTAPSEADKQDAINALTTMAGEPVSDTADPRADRVIRDLLKDIGMPCHILGHDYTVAALKVLLRNSDMIHCITKELYPLIAQEAGSSASRVERAIRHAIESAWDRGDIDTLHGYFGNTISLTKCKPTNAEFLAQMVGLIRERLE